MAQVSVDPTTIESHGHSLGVFRNVMRKFCVRCKAGCGYCYHIAAMFHSQRLHWGDARPTAKPSTSDWCLWLPGSQTSKRPASLIQPASASVRLKLPTSKADAKARTEKGIKRNCHLGVPALYKFHDSDEKMAAFNLGSYRHPSRFEDLYKCLRNANEGRPCKAEIRWHGATDNGLTDVCESVMLWGTESEQARWHQLCNDPENKDKSNSEISKMVLAEDWPSKLKEIHIEELDKIDNE